MTIWRVLGQMTREGVGQRGCKCSESLLWEIYTYFQEEIYHLKPLILKIFHFSLSPTVSFLRLPMLVQTVVGC